jgi:hypothetical protein
MDAEHRAEVVGAYTAAVRLKLYARVAALLALLAFVAVLGAMIVGWMDIDSGVVLLTWALLLGLVTAAKIYDESVRTRLGAARMERGVATDEDLYASVPVMGERVKTITGVAVLIFALAAAGILGFSFANAGSEKDDDDDDDDDQSAAIVYIAASEGTGAE